MACMRARNPNEALECMPCASLDVSQALSAWLRLWHSAAVFTLTALIWLLGTASADSITFRVRIDACDDARRCMHLILLNGFMGVWARVGYNGRRVNST